MDAEREKEIKSRRLRIEGEPGSQPDPFIVELFEEIDRLLGESEWRHEAAKNYANALGEAISDLERRTNERNKLREKLAVAEKQLEIASYHHQGKHGIGEGFREALAKIRGSNDT